MEKAAYIALERLNLNGYESYLVGGSVRNFLLNLPVHDYDITTNADPNAIKMLFNDYPVYDLGRKLGTVGVKINDLILEITPYRKEGNYSDHRHPEEISFSNELEEDLKRRDFTINALCMDKDEKIVDLYDGINDLNKRIIRAIGNPDVRFNEDALRILRAIRFKTKLNFEIEENTNQSLFKNKELLNHISIERKVDELKQILIYENAFDILKEYKDIFDIFFKIERIDFKTNIFKDSIYTLSYLKHLNDYDLKSLKLSYRETELIELLSSISDINIEDDYQFICSLSNIYTSDCLNYLSQYKGVDLSERYENLKKYIITINDLDIDGNTLMELGYSGKKISEIKKILTDQVHKKFLLNNKQVLLKYLKENSL